MDTTTTPIPTEAVRPLWHRVWLAIAAAAAGRRRRGLVDRLSRLPHWAIALVLLAPVWVLNEAVQGDRLISSQLRPWVGWAYAYTTSVALFLPGAVRRRDGRAALVLLAVAAAATGWDLSTDRLWSRLPALVVIAGPTVLTATFVAGAEWALTGRRRAVVWPTALASVTAGLVAQLVLRPVWYSTGFVTFPVGTFSRVVPVVTLLWTPVIAVAVWTMVPLGLRAVGRRRRAWIVGAVIVAVTAYVGFFQFAVIPLARLSLAGRGPFNQTQSVYILGGRPTPANRAALWAFLDSAEWRTRLTIGPYDIGDGRRAAIWVVIQMDGPAVAPHLAALLMAHPSDSLADEVAGVIADARQYQAAPVLLRLSMLGDEKSTAALEQWRVPQAALGIIRTAAADLATDRRWGRPAVVPDATRRRLERLLGRPVGPTMRDLANAYHEGDSRRPTPLPAAVSADLVRVSRAMMVYNQAWVDLVRAGIDPTTVTPPDWQVPTTAELERQTAAYAAAARARLGGTTRPRGWSSSIGL